MKSMKSTIERTNEKEVLKILSEQAPVGVCIMQDGKFCYVNSTFLIAIGYTADELVGKDSLAIVVPEDREMVMENTIKMLKGELLSPYQFRVICKDGSIIWVMATVKSIQYHEKQAVLGNYMEVTERKQMEEALKEREERYRELANSITDVFFAMDEHLRYTYWNKASEVLTGIRAEDAIGKSLREVFPDTDWRRKAEKVYRKVLKTQQPQTFVNAYDTDGRHYIFEISAYPTQGGISVFVKDIAERKQARDKLEESEQKYRLLFETSTDCINQIDREGRYLAANSATAKSLGVPLEELVGKTVFEVMPKEVAQRRLKNVIKVLNEGQPQISEDEREGRYFHHIVIPMKTPDQKEAVQVITRDITERKQAEEKLRQSEENYKTLFNSAVVGMYVMDAETMKVVMGNRAAAEIAGFGFAEEGIGVNPFDFVVPEDREKVLEIAINEFLQDSRRTHEIQVMDKNGQRRWHSISIARIMHKGRLASLVSFTDITDRKQAEEALRQSEEKYRTILERMEDSYFEVDLAGNLTFVNNSVCRDLGYSREELIGRNYKIFTAEEDIESVFRVFNEVYRTGVPNKGYSWKTTRKDGSHGFAETSASPLRNDKGEIVGFSGVGRDVSERKQMEDKLKESEQKYRLLFETSPDCIAQIDREGRYLAANPAVAKSLGVPVEELNGKPVSKVMSKEVAQHRLRMLRKALDEWQTQIFEDERAGRYFHHIIIPIKTSSQKEAVQAITRDITERKQAEEALRQSEEKHRALFDSSVIGMFVMDAATMKMVMCNQAAARMMGFSSVEEAIGVNPIDFVLPEHKEKALEITIKEMFEQDLRRTHEYRVVNKDGREGWVSVTGARITHEGKLAGLVSITDITDRKQAVEALRQSEERYRTILDEMEDSYFEVDLGGHLTFVNNATCRKLGYSEEELLGTSYKKTTLEDDIESVFRSFNEVYRTGKPNKSCLWTIVCKDGTHRLIEHSVFPLRNDKGEIIGFRGVGRDITERKQAEEKLQQSEERYRALFDNSVIGTLLLDAETMQVLMGNEAAAKIFGFSSLEEGAGINVLDFVPQEDRELNRELIKRELFEQDSRRDYDVRAITKDGREIWINVTGVRMMHKGRLIGMVTFTDVTERKQAEEALRRSEERYRTILEDMEDSYFEVDLGGHLTFANDSVCRDLGYSREELIGRSYKDYTSEEDIESVFRVFNEVYQTGVPNKGFAWKTTRKDGSHGFAETSVSTLRNDKGEIIGFRGVGRDVTERKQTEEKLQQSRENYRALFDSSVIGAVVVDAETMKIVMANQATLKMFGFSSPEAGVNPLDFSPPEDRQRNLELIVKEVFEKDSRESIDLPVVTKDGRKIWVSVTGARITHKGRLAALLSFTDITERKQAEEKLRQSEENYRALFDSTVIGTVLLDAETMKIAMANQAAVKMFGFSSEEEVLGLDPFSFVLPEDRERYIEIATKALFEQNMHEPFEIRAVGKDGREKWINTTATVITYKGKLTGLISFADITEQKKQREQLMMTDRLASLGELASGTAHELNNPLTSIIGFSQLLMEREVPDDIREDLKLINNEAQRAASVTKDLLTFARKHAPVKQRNQINNIIEDILKLRAHAQKNSGIEVVRHLDPDLPEIMVDYFQMQQVFMNIIINAEYVMTEAHNKGTLTITTKKQNDTARISIADDGPGIPPENLKRIFDPFFTTKEAGKGTGLGLSICHGIVTEHGGQIYAESQLGKGATFFVELPINGRDHIKRML